MQMMIFSVCYGDKNIALSNYTSEMSKNDDVCSHMLSIFNQNGKKYGATKLAAHSEFSFLPWMELEGGINVSGSLRYKEIIFDINNDGKKDVVIKQIGFLNSVESDNLFIYLLASSELNLMKEKNRDKYLIGKLEYTGSFYNLKELPPFIISRGQFKGKKTYQAFGGMFGIHPVKFKNHYYISISKRTKNWVPGTIEHGLWQVIEKYEDNALNDICYFKKNNFIITL